MNGELTNIKAFITSSEDLSPNEKESLLLSIKSVQKEVTILQFKLQRTEKVKRTTSVLLEETIEELEQKRKDIENSNETLRRTIEQLKATQKQLIQSEKMASLGELTAGIAHEIKNPLNFVNNFADVSQELLDEMKEELESDNIEEGFLILEDIKQNLVKITHHGTRADAIVKSMLQHSRTSAGKKEIVDLNSLCDEYLRLAFHGLRAKDKSFNAAFETNLDTSCPKVKVLPQDFGRVILNLINNAFQATSKYAKTQAKSYQSKVVVSTHLLRNIVEIRVEDNGPGIPEDIKSKIFQPFFTTKPTGEGTGLGLSLSYDIINSHGGTLAFENISPKKGNGVVFIITLPVN